MKKRYGFLYVPYWLHSMVHGKGAELDFAFKVFKCEYKASEV